MITKKALGEQFKRMFRVFPEIHPESNTLAWWEVLCGWEPTELEAVVDWFLANVRWRKEFPAPAAFVEAREAVKEAAYEAARLTRKRSDCQVCDGTGFELTRPDPQRQNLARYCSCDYGQRLRRAREDAEWRKAHDTKRYASAIQSRKRESQGAETPEGGGGVE